MVPMRGREWFWRDSRLRGSGRGGFDGDGWWCRELVWAAIAGKFDGGEEDAVGNAGLIGSWSGGGVGGNMLRLTGGSDCCLDLLCRPGLTRLEAPNDIDSRGRSSTSLFMAAACALASALTEPINALLWSDVAINLALPR